MFLVLPFLAYFVWEYYWYTKVGLRVIHWHTHLAVYAYLWAVGFIVFIWIKKKLHPSYLNNLFLLFCSIIFSLFLIEVYLSISGNVKTYMEQCTGYYTSPYEPLDKDYYHVWRPNVPHQISKPEYSFMFPTNSLGLPDREWTTTKTPKEKRILALGDSFTEGDGAAYDSSYVAALKRKLATVSDSFYVMNGGVCGSDPFINYILLKNRLLVYQPEVVLQVLATGDMNTDIILRGGMERFQKNGTLKYTPAPWWEPVYAVSYISRLFFSAAGYNELLRKNGLSLTSEEVTKLNTQLSGLFESYISLCRKHNIRLVIILRPDKAEIMNNKYEYDFSAILNPVKAEGYAEVIDLLPPYRGYIEKATTNAADYFWKNDGHHNAKGYEMMAQSIYENILPLLIDTVSTHSKPDRIENH